MPFAGFESFDACLVHMQGKGYGSESAHKICGRLQADHERTKRGIGQMSTKTKISAELGTFDPYTRSIPILASTVNEVDGEALEDSWDFSRFAKNPVILWSHDASKLPVGLASGVTFMPGVGVKMTVSFASAAANPLAEQLARCVAEGLVRAVSVGYTNEKGKHILDEVSFVSIGADEDAGTPHINLEHPDNEGVVKRAITPFGEGFEHAEIAAAAKQTDTSKAPKPFEVPGVDKKLRNLTGDEDVPSRTTPAQKTRDGEEDGGDSVEMKRRVSDAARTLRLHRVRYAQLRDKGMPHTDALEIFDEGLMVMRVDGDEPDASIERDWFPFDRFVKMDDAEWDESKHPRDDHGRFGSGGGGGGGSEGKGGSAGNSNGSSGKESGGKGSSGNQIPKTSKGTSDKNNPNAKDTTEYGKSKVGEKAGDPYGHPPPSTSPTNYKPDPTSTRGAPDGLTAAARVGIPGKEAPPPYVVPRLAGLSVDERAVEKRFADAFEKNPQHFIDAYKAQVYGAVKKDGSPDEIARKTFGTDDCKNLSPDYAKNAENKALYNVAVHQTANMIAKAAFEQHMAEKVAKMAPEDRKVLVTAGGCAAGKGFALKNAPTEDVKGALGKAAAVWDTAGEQNSTELPWVQKHTEAVGGHAHYVFVDADPKVTFDRVVSRAQGTPAKGDKPAVPGEGRVVDKLLHAESYVIGAKNFEAFAKANASNPHASITYINVRVPPNTTEKPASIADGISKDAKSMTVREVHAANEDYIKKNAERLSPAVLKGATVSKTVWGAT